jgi:hypothetical protein
MYLFEFSIFYYFFFLPFFFRFPTKSKENQTINVEKGKFSITHGSKTIAYA